MACQCGCSTGAPTADVPSEASTGCGCSTEAPEGLNVASLARMVRELDDRVKELELETSH